MAVFHLDSIEALARQMTFTPAEVRGEQVGHAEELLHDIDPNKAYPLEFVVYRITGYHPKTSAAELLTGLALQHDLGLLIEQLSETLDLHSASLAEPVLSIDDVTEKFNVTSKTIQRWRRRGLPARRFMFPDGKRRVGFLLSSVDRFFASHREQLSDATNVAPLDERERDQILAHAERLALAGRCSAGEMVRRIARKLNRSPLAVLHTIRKYDQENPQAGIFKLAARALSDVERARVLTAMDEKTPLRMIARRMDVSRQAVYRVMIEGRIARLTGRKVRFIDDTLYHQPEAAAAIRAIVSPEALPASPSAEELRVPRDLPAYLQELYRTPLLTPQRERALFLEFNFHKFQFLKTRRSLEPQFARVRELDVMESHLRDAMKTRNDIIRANLRLVVSIARKHLRPGLDLMELISDGNITLMRAVEGFDIHKGFRFSTYATLALMKGFARSVPLMRSKSRAFSHEDALADIPDLQTHAAGETVIARDHVRQLLTQLSDRERSVLLAHYGISRCGLKEIPQPSTYEQVAEQLGLSKQRVRQIEQMAIAKLRDKN